MYRKIFDMCKALLRAFWRALGHTLDLKWPKWLPGVKFPRFISVFDCSFRLSDVLDAQCLGRLHRQQRRGLWSFSLLNVMVLCLSMRILCIGTRILCIFCMLCLALYISFARLPACRQPAARPPSAWPGRPPGTSAVHIQFYIQTPGRPPQRTLCYITSLAFLTL